MRRGFFGLIAVGLALVAGPALAQCPGLFNPGAQVWGVCMGFITLPSGGGVNPAILASVNADGWSAIPTTPTTYSPDTSPVIEAVVRSGYGTDGLWHSSNYTDSLTLTQRVRQVYPNYASLDGSRTALSDWVYSTDVLTGTTNNSTKLSPKPVAEFATADHQVVVGSGTLTIQFLAYHRNAHSQGAPIPYASCTATDGTHTETEAAVYYAALPAPPGPLGSASWSDVHKSMGQQVVFTNLGTFNAGAFTVDCTVYPWAGGNGDVNSILQSSAATYSGFSTQHFYHLASAGPVYYVANTTATPAGSDTNAGTRAAPFATLAKAFNALCPTSTCNRAGATVYLMEDGAGLGATQNSGGIGPTYTDAGNGEVAIAADPLATGTVALTISVAVNAKTPYLRFANLRINRGGDRNVQANNAAGSHIVLENVTMDVTGSTFSTFTTGSNYLYFLGGSLINMTSSVGDNTLEPSTAQRVMLFRGNTTHAVVNNENPLDCVAVIGSDTQGMHCTLLTATYDYSGGVLAHTQMMAIGGSNDMFDLGNSTTAQALNGYAIIDVMMEDNSASAGPGGGLSRDPSEGMSINNLLLWNDTFTGVNNGGRWNILYDNNNTTSGQCIGTGGGSTPYCTVRTHGYVSMVGNLFPQINMKNDKFVATSGSDTADAPFHFGNFPQYYGVGFRDSVVSYKDAGGGYVGIDASVLANDFSQAYGGLNTYVGVATTTRTDLFTGYASVTYNGTTYTAGAGNGTYTLCTSAAGSCTAASPAYQHFKGPTLLPLTLSGVARSATNDNAGAF